MTWSGRTARQVPKAVARTLALAGLLAASGIAAGTASAAGGGQAQGRTAVATALAYQCRFPSGSRPVEVTVTAGLPVAGRTGRPVQPAGVRLKIALPQTAVADLARLHFTAVSAATVLSIDATNGPSGASVVWPGAGGRAAEVPARGPLALQTSGRVPSVTPTLPGDVTLSAAGLSLTLTPGRATAVPGSSPAPVPSTGPNEGAAATPPATGGTPPATAGTPLRVTCALGSGQHATLATMPVAGAATQQSRHAPTAGNCPKLPPGGLKLNPRFPPPPHPPLTLVAHSPSQGCAFTTGYADVRKLNGAALIAPALTNVDQALTTLANLTNKVNYLQLQNAAQLDFHGRHQFPPSTATFLSFGFVPTTATIELIEHGTINIFVVGPVNPFIPCQPNRFRTCSNVATVFSRLSARIAPGSVKVNGVPLNVGSHCETPPFDAVVTGTSASKPPYSIQFGGPLTGMVTIPPFKNCGVGENLNPIFNAAISGPQNFNLLTQGELCSVIGAVGCDNHGRPKIPTPIRKVTG